MRICNRRRIDSEFLAFGALGSDCFLVATFICVDQCCVQFEFGVKCNSNVYVSFKSRQPDIDKSSGLCLRVVFKFFIGLS